jgi:hypothetical protein
MKAHKSMKVARGSLRRTGFLFLWTALFLLAVNAATLQGREDADAIITEKAFPFYHCVARNPAFADAIRKDEVLQTISRQQVRRIQTALEQCGDVDCSMAAVQWNPEEMADIGNRLAKLCRRYKDLRPLLAQLKAGGRCNLYKKQSDADFIKSVWHDSALGINRILDTYIKGKKPRYPAVDAISFPVEDAEFRDKIRKFLAEQVKPHASEELFFELPLKLALKALAINGRDEAARYEPLVQGMNANAVQRIAGIRWRSYRYSLILVPGQGPEDEGLPLDPMGIQRCKMAAERHQRGLAPFIVVSGGHVHPNKTPYSEAVEMRKYLVQELHIPENAILIDPHARHTTTNLRNVARMVYRFKIPDSKKILTVTDPVQSAYIPKMKKRFLDELKYIPYRGMKILNKEENEFYPVQNALQANPFDPLDP